MLLSARLLGDTQGPNSYNNVDQLEFTQGDTINVYFQLVDLTKDRVEKGYVPAGRRFIPAAGATLQVTFTNIDDSKQILKRWATQPFTGDLSIWMVPIASTDLINGTVDMILYLQQGATITTGRVPAALAISPSGTP